MAGALALVATVAHANPLSLARFGGLRGDPILTGPWAIFWNPSGLAHDGPFAAVHMQSLSRQASYDRDAASNDVPPDLVLANTGENHVTSRGVVPGFVAGYGIAWGDFTLAGAGALYAAEAGRAAWDKVPGAPSEHPGALDGPQRWSTIHTDIKFIRAAAGFSVAHIPSGLAIGVSPSVTSAELSLTRARNANGDEAVVDGSGRLKEGRIFYEGDDTRLQWILGARWNIDGDFTVAATWHRRIDFDFRGNAELAFARDPVVEVRDAHVNQPLPDTVRLGARYSVLSWLALRPSVEWTRWSIFDEQISTGERVSDGEQVSLMLLPRHFDDGYALRLRGDIAVSNALEVLAGAGYEHGPTPESTHEPGLAEGNSFELGVGLSARLTDDMTLSASAYWHQFLDRDVRTSQHVPTTNGSYTDRRQYVTLDLELW